MKAKKEGSVTEPSLFAAAGAFSAAAERRALRAWGVEPRAQLGSRVVRDADQHKGDAFGRHAARGLNRPGKSRRSAQAHPLTGPWFRHRFPKDTIPTQADRAEKLVEYNAIIDAAVARMATPEGMIDVADRLHDAINAGRPVGRIKRPI